MGIEKIVKTRKTHICSSCNKKIKKGSKVLYFESRTAKYDNNTAHYDYDGTQIGIEYQKHYYHIKCLQE